jgi:drug/metabolite transporter (DMT)-like permease
MILEHHIQKYSPFYIPLIMILWGFSWPVSKLLTEYCDTYILMFLKFFLSSITQFFLILLFFRKTIYFSYKLFKPLLLALLFIIFYNVLYFHGLQIGYASLGGVIVTGSNPIFTFLIIALFEKVKIDTKQKVALLLGIIGTLITVDIFSLKLDYIFDSGNVLFLLASLSWSFVIIFSSNAK